MYVPALGYIYVMTAASPITEVYLGLPALVIKMYLGLPALETKMYPGLPAPVARADTFRCASSGLVEICWKSLSNFEQNYLDNIAILTL